MHHITNMSISQIRIQRYRQHTLLVVQRKYIHITHIMHELYENSHTQQNYYRSHTPPLEYFH